MPRGRELKLGVLALLTLVWLGGATARADDETTAPRREMPVPGLEPVPQLETSYTFGGKTKFEGTRAGNSDAFNTRLELAEPIPLASR